MPKFRNIGGTHYVTETDGEGPEAKARAVAYPRGSIVVSDLPLDKLHANKFERIHEEVVERPEWPPKGFEDVTAEFDDAGSNGLAVLRRGKTDYAVCLAGNDATAPLNTDKPLKRSEVPGFIDTYLAAQKKGRKAAPATK